MTEKIYEDLMQYSNLHELKQGLTKEKILEFETENKISLPEDLKELYQHFDGGELFIPGTTVYGLYDPNVEYTIRNANRSEVRQKMSLPRTYLIIASLNYGDLICLDLNAPYKVIQWSHETDEMFCEWDNLEQWLREMIEDYKEFEESDQA